MFVAAEKLSASDALRIGLVDAIADDPVAEAIRRIQGILIFACGVSAALRRFSPRWYTVKSSSSDMPDRNESLAVNSRPETC